MESRESRALLFAVAASLALHAATLLLAPGFRAPIRPPALPTLTAVLRALPQPEEPTQATHPQPEAQPSPQPRPAPEARPKPEVAKSRPQTQPVVTAPSTRPAPAVPAAASALPETKPAPAAPASSAGVPPTTVAAAAPNVAAARGEPADPNALQNYKLQLAGYAAKYKRYPRLALDRNWEGIAEVKLTIGADGRIREVNIASSSGHEILDQQAVEMVRKAAPATEITSALRNKEFSINLPIVFNIERKGG